VRSAVGSQKATGEICSVAAQTAVIRSSLPDL